MVIGHKVTPQCHLNEMANHIDDTPMTTMTRCKSRCQYYDPIILFMVFSAMYTGILASLSRLSKGSKMPRPLIVSMTLFIKISNFLKRMNDFTNMLLSVAD